jgi:hypothetical protein
VRWASKKGAHLAFWTNRLYNTSNNKEVILATTVYDVLEITLQNDQDVTVRPLDLKRLRKVMAVMDEMNKAAVASVEKKDDDSPLAENDTDNLDFLIRAAAICLEKQLPDLVKDTDALEEALDLPTLWKILEVAAGVSMGSPNLQGEAALPGLI